MVVQRLKRLVRLKLELISFTQKVRIKLPSTVTEHRFTLLMTLRPYFDQNVKSDRTYTYNCKATVGNEEVSGEDIAVTTLSPLQEVEKSIGEDFVGCLTAEAISTSQIKITYQFPQKVDRIKVERSGSNIHTNSTYSSPHEFIDAGLSEGVNYTYTCFCCSGRGDPRRFTEYYSYDSSI